ncbi:D-alanine--D-alanine ligase [Terrisporobacter mayombei]|uniref:D-alanine--D-alanine ligase n=1 Tax=Terrisporobacter mayombei TaxID=1541 RepID=A0ABY9Q2A3_9FIRM|nr:D-alanine--D-alanine ligase [Terrisporobacter mayombei]MCC3867081.1 D-alanine--D-alanine ligase [Terrisporobacter mayombei]WMT81341.1 D-alanine--D-alanine ligase [Terrisporobacter mayombei]
MKKKVAVLMGGISTEREVSLNSGRSVLNSLDRDKYEVHEIILNNKMDVINKMPEGIEFAFLMLHGKYGEDGTIQAILESMDIPYSGCGPLTSAMCMDKNITKKMLRDSGVPTADWTIAKSIDDIDYDKIEEMGYPIFIKPNSGGSSVATFKVERKEDVEAAVKAGLEVDNVVMIEQYLPGDEYTSFVLDGEIYPTIKISTTKGFFDYEAKYSTGASAAKEEIVYLDDELQEQIDKASKTIWDIFYCRAYVRVDFILSNGKFYVLELNTLPGMTTTSLIPRSANAKGLSYSQLVDKILETSIK